MTQKKKSTFATYALTVIHNHIYDCSNNYNRAIRLPTSIYHNAKCSENKERYLKIIEEYRTVSLEDIEQEELMQNIDLAENIIRNEQITRLKKAIESLPPEDQELLIDRYITDNMTYEKIAKKNRKSYSYVRRRIIKLCKLLKEWLEEDENDD